MLHLGVLSAVAAYTILGINPIFFKLLKDVPALQVLCHRVVWSAILLALYILCSKQWNDFCSSVFESYKRMAVFVCSSVFVTTNWGVYVWSVSAGYIVEASLGYFIMPLFCDLVGVIFFRERLRIIQQVAVLVAASGVIYLAITNGRFPWIALTLAFSFTMYGVLKKMSPVSSVHSLAIETALVFPVALTYLLVMEGRGDGAFGHGSILDTFLMMGAGPVTTIPLLFFCLAAKNTSMTVFGLVQYIQPTLQFLLGVLLYDEPFNQKKLIGFILVWVGLLVFSVESYWVSRKETEEKLQEVQIDSREESVIVVAKKLPSNADDLSEADEGCSYSCSRSSGIDAGAVTQPVPAI